jgi:putative inorganic carbon (HCO3(-)) transporter
LALSFVIAIPLCLAFLFLARRSAWKAFWMLGILAMTSAILETGSRGGFLALGATAAACLWQFAIRGRRPRAIAIAAFAGAILCLSFGGMVMGRLKGTFDPKEDTAAAYASTEERQELLWRSIQVTREHPLFGVGPGNFMQASGTWHVTHNSYTQMSSEGGIPALLLYLVLLGCAFDNIRTAKRLANRQKETTLFAKALHCSLLGYVTGSFFLSMTYAFFPYFLVAYTTSLVLLARKSAASAAKLELPAAAISLGTTSAEPQELELALFSAASNLESATNGAQVCAADEFAQ